MSDVLTPFTQGFLEQVRGTLQFIEGQGGGQLVITYNGTKEDKDSAWMIATTFGEEEPGSDMVGGASYGIGSDPRDAMSNVAREIGLTDQ